MSISKQKDNQGNMFYYNEKRQYHRTDGPAIEWADGDNSWYLNGKLHRTDGPAIDWASGEKEWWINGKELTEEEFKRKTTKLYRILYGEV